MLISFKHFSVFLKMSNKGELSSKVAEDSSNVLKVIINSRLLADDDYNIVASTMAFNMPELGNQFRRGCMAVTIAAVVNISASLVNKYTASSLLKSLPFIPACIITVGCTHYLGKIIFDNYSTQKNNKIILNHVRILQMFYKLMHTITNDINNLEKTVPESHIQRELMEQLHVVYTTIMNEVNGTMSNGSIKLIQEVPHTVKNVVFSIHAHENSGLLENFDTTGFSEGSPNDMIHTYQVNQSEYLRWLALCHSTLNDKLAKKRCMYVVNSVHSVILKCYCELNYQYIVNFHGLMNDYRLKPIDEKKVASYIRADIWNDEVPSIMLHLVSLTEETQSLQSLLNISATLEVKNECSEADILKIFAIKFNKFKKKWRQTNDCILKIDTDLEMGINICSSVSLLEKDVAGETAKYTKDYLAGTPVSPGRLQVTGRYDFSDDEYLDHDDLSFQTADISTTSGDSSVEEFIHLDVF